MSQHDYVLANQARSAFRADLNDALAAIASTNKGPAAPSAPSAGQLWVDDDTPSATVWTLNVYDGSQWIALGTIDITNNVFVPSLNIDRLTAETAPAVGDSIALYDLSATASRKMTLANLLKVIAGLTAETAPAVDDELALIDTSTGDADKITLANLFKVIAGLTAETAPAIDDELAIYDTSAGTADKITLANLLKVINGLTEDTTPDAAADFVVTFDASASASKKVKLSNLSGAPGAASVGQSQLKTATSEASFGFNSGAGKHSDTSFAGGEYGYWPLVRYGTQPPAWWQVGFANAIIQNADGNGDVPFGRLGALNTTSTNRVTLSAGTEGSAGNLFAVQRYITASPPYDWGDGLLHGFIFLRLERGSGRVIAGWSATDPVWAYNGPTKTRADIFLDPLNIPLGLWDALGRGTKVIPAIKARRTTETLAAARAAGRLARHLDELANGEETFEAVTLERKMRDMAEIPHPFFNLDPAREIVVLLDPLSDFLGKLFAADGQLDGESLLSLIHAGDIKFGNDDLAAAQKRGGPRGVLQVAGRLR